MKLDKYLAQEGLTLTDFAKRIGRSVSTVSRLARGETQPDWTTMELIEAETDGRVRPDDFRATAAA